MTIVITVTTSVNQDNGALTYLELAQRLRRKVRAKGSGPTDVTGQSEEEMRLLSYINEAWMSIQRLHTDWNFLRASVSCVTVEGQYAYAGSEDFAVDDFGYWALDYDAGDTFRCYQTSVGLSDEQQLDVVEYDDWRNRYLLGSNRTQYQRPLEVAVAPNRALTIGPIPAAGYTLIGDYYKVPTELALSTDTPTLPGQFHMAIVYRAMMFFGVSEAAPEIYDEGKTEFKILKAEMEATQLRNITTAGAFC